MKLTDQTITVTVKVNVALSWTAALKLRLAGAGGRLKQEIQRDLRDSEDWHQRFIIEQNASLTYLKALREANRGIGRLVRRLHSRKPIAEVKPLATYLHRICSRCRNYFLLPNGFCKNCGFDTLPAQGNENAKDKD